MESLADTRPLKNNIKFLKPGHYVSCKDGKHMVANTFLRFSPRSTEGRDVRPKS